MKKLITLMLMAIFAIFINGVASPTSKAKIGKNIKAISATMATAVVYASPVIEATLEPMEVVPLTADIVAKTTGTIYAAITTEISPNISPGDAKYFSFITTAAINKPDTGSPGKNVNTSTAADGVNIANTAGPEVVQLK